MFRFVGVAIIQVVILGGVGWYLHTINLEKADPSTHSFATEEKPVERLSAELTVTFSPQVDPFALGSDPFSLPEENGNSPALLSVQFNGEEVFQITEENADTIQPGVPFAVDSLPQAILGKNELLVVATPPSDQASQSQAVRIKLLREDNLLQEETFWSGPGERLVASFRFELSEASLAVEDADHHE
ncbi:Hypothetical protein PBC10988_12320 [Planctomycetales bacterium 10988]|nr:Hypothetical protein PBC10988_12320 [Planctomycetales bacterium 10988]